MALAIAAMVLLGCEASKDSQAVKAGPEEVRERFADVTAGSGIDFLHVSGATGARHMPETVAGGAAWLDYDLDGDLDLYCVSGNLHPDRGGPGPATNRLFRNDRGGRFTDATAEAGVGGGGYGMGATVADYDNDGRPDLYVTQFTLETEGGNLLYHNEGGRFSDVARAAGVAAGGWCTGAAFFDYDGDGQLDLYVARYARYDPSKHCREGGVPTYCGPSDFPGGPDVLFHNRGDGTFEDVSVSSGVGFEDPAGGAGLGVLALDYDDDGDADVFVANDQGPNYLLRNDQGRFTDVALLAGVAYGPLGTARAGMGVDAGDVDGDGREDIVVTNFADEPDGLFVAEGGGFFHDAAEPLGVAGPTKGPLAFGVVLFDHDLDGDLDLYVAEGHTHDNIADLPMGAGKTYAQPDLLLDGRGGRFVDISGSSGAWFKTARVGRGVAAGDYDEDGDEDLFVVNSRDRGVLLENRAPRSGGWLALRLRGTRANRDGVGARVAVIITAEDGSERARTFEVRRSRSYLSSCDPRVRVGLGTERPRSIRAVVRWPGPLHTVEEYRDLIPGRTTELVESPEEAARHPATLPAARAPGTAASAPPASGSAAGGAGTGSPPAAPGSATAPSLEAALARAGELRARRRMAEALAALEAVPETARRAAAPAVERDARVMRADLLINLGRPVDAAAILERLAREEPRETRHRVLLGRAYVSSGRLREALEVFEKLRAEGVPLDPDSRRTWAAALIDSGRPAQALVELADALAADPWLDTAHLDVGRALGRLGRPAEAAPFFERYRRGEAGRKTETLALMAEAAGQKAAAAYTRGEIELLRGRVYPAMVHFNRALSLDPRHGPAFVAILRLSARIERQQAALARIAPGGPPEIEEARAEIEASLRAEADPDGARRAARERMAGKPLPACAADLAELAIHLAPGNGARARELALFAAEIDERCLNAQIAVAEVFGAPDEAFVRLWALDRALRINPGDTTLRDRRDALRRPFVGERR